MYMMMTDPGYDPQILAKWRDESGKSEWITRLLDEYLSAFEGAIGNKPQREHVRVYIRGLLSDLDRKSVEPIALNLLGERGVRALQQFLTRATLDEERILATYRSELARRINSENGMLSVDESDFAKKGKESAGVQRQYCGRLGKTENCQAACLWRMQGGRGMVCWIGRYIYRNAGFAKETSSVENAVGYRGIKRLRARIKWRYV